MGQIASKLLFNLTALICFQRELFAKDDDHKGVLIYIATSILNHVTAQ